MKTLLVPTDFSPQADNAARFAVHLAKNLKCAVQLCHAINVPEESPIAEKVVWPLEDYNHLKEEADRRLDDLCRLFVREEQSQSDADGYHPLITRISQVGVVTDVVRNLVCNADIQLVVMGLSGARRMSRFFLGSSSRDVIEKGGFPTLLIPGQCIYRGIKKVAFATDLDPDDVQRICQLATLLKPLNPEILIVHVTTGQQDAAADALEADAFISNVTNNVNYCGIYYRNFKSSKVQESLNALSEQEDFDMLVMVHKRHSIYDWLVSGSYTQKLARHTHIPLLVYPNL